MSRLDLKYGHFSSFIDVLRERGTEQADRRAFTFLGESEGDETSVTYAQLDAAARRIGALLQDSRLRGERVLLLYPPGLEYIAAFYGCMYAGAVAVPAYPPDLTRLQRTLPRLQAIAASAQAGAALTQSFILEAAADILFEVEVLRDLRWMASDASPAADPSFWRHPGSQPEDLAFLQYTSGSTALPKGVKISFGNLLHNSEVIRTLCRVDSQTRGVGWLPPYHDMGLVAGLLQAVYSGFSGTLMSPVTFLKDPERFLRRMSAERADYSGGPSFSFDLCVRKVRPETIQELDLSHWRIAAISAERVRPETIARFVQTFAPCGFRSETFFPCYGLAEGTLLITGKPDMGAPPTVSAFSRFALQQSQARLAVGDEPAQVLVGCGRAIPDHEVRIVDPESLQPLAAGQIGEVCVHGPSVSSGYWNLPDQNARLLWVDPHTGRTWLRTGDLGFQRAGDLYITGRLKDLLIIDGVNHFPDDIEASAQAVSPKLRSGCGAAISIDSEAGERLVIVQEVDSSAPEELDELADRVAAAVFRDHSVAVHEICFLQRATIYKTSSGKIQRHLCREAYLGGALGVLRRGTWQS